MTDRLGEALPGWVICPICNGSGIVAAGHPEPHRTTAPCPDCVDGLTPSPELVNRAAMQLALELGHTVASFNPPKAAPNTLRIARAVLLASRQGDTHA